jgi:hypothetical protein
MPINVKMLANLATRELNIPVQTADETKRGKVLSVNLPDTADPAVISSVEEAVEKALAIVLGGPASASAAILERADRLAELVSVMVEPSVELVAERRRRRRTIEKILRGTDWVTAEDLNALQPDPPANKSHPASDWKRRGRIFGVSYGGKEYFARYQFDALYQPLPVLKDVLKVFGAVADPWTLAAWFHFPNGWIVKESRSGPVPVAPKDALDRRDALLEAAAKRRTSYVA